MTKFPFLAAAFCAALIGVGETRAAAPAPGKVTPELIEAAKKEGKAVWYTSAEVSIVERIAKVFKEKYPGIEVQVERSGAERNFQRLQQEYDSGIHNADVIESSDVTNFLIWKKNGWLAPYVPEGMAAMPAQYQDADGMYGPFRATLCVMGYNTKLVKPEDAPKSFADLLDPKWTGKIAKAHPGYSGTIMTATNAMLPILGWDYFEKLGKQKVMQVQSANDPPRKISLGERPIMADGVEYTLLKEKDRGAPVAPIYPSEGTPLVIGSAGVAKDAPHPNAARLLDEFLFSTEGQQLIIDVGDMRSLNPNVKEPATRTALKDIKLLPDDPASTLAHIEEIKQKYAQDFGI